MKIWDEPDGDDDVGDGDDDNGSGGVDDGYDGGDGDGDEPHLLSPKRVPAQSLRLVSITLQNIWR